MAASALPKPGTEYGPCKSKCKHIDCASTRATSEAACRFCAKAIGYDKRFYADPDNQGAFVHAICLEESVEREVRA